MRFPTTWFVFAVGSSSLKPLLASNDPTTSSPIDAKNNDSGGDNDIDPSAIVLSFMPLSMST